LLLAVAVDPQLTEADLVELVGLDAVEAAVAERVISLAEGGRVRAWHPMLAAAARESATPSRRRELHGRLADVVASPERRLRHRALVTTSGDDLLAADLSAAAVTAGDRGASETALELAELALARTPTGSPARIGRVLDVASRLASVGEAQRLTDMLGPEVEHIPDGPERGRALLMLLDGMWGSVDYAERLVERALAECGDDRDVRSRALEVKSVIAAGIRVSGVAAARAWAEEAMALSDHDDREWRNLSDAANWCLVHSGRPPRPAEGPAHWKRLIWRGEMAEAERLVREAVSAAEEGGRYQEASILTVSLSDVLVRSGRIDEARAFAAAQEDIDLTAVETPDVELLRAEIEVRYGDPAVAREWAWRARDAAEALGHVWIRMEADRALAMADLQSGDPDGAAARLRAVFDHVVAAEVREPGMFPVAPELVEALVLLGRLDEARSVLDWLDEVSVEQAHPWGRAMGQRGRVLVGLAAGSSAPTEAASTIDAVAADLRALGLTHDAARAHLAVGSALRRQRQWGLARDHLTRAGELFEALDAAGWAQTTRSELDRVGGRRPTVPGELSAAELETARLASEGVPNKAIARQLKVSVSTVEANLTKVYAKLGVGSRAQLAVRLGELER
jgi:DNA-binding CsgD family transcriptional regulator